jgi:hypothetical protein
MGKHVGCVGQNESERAGLGRGFSPLNEGKQICKGFSGAIAFGQIADIQRTVFVKEA